MADNTEEAVKKNRNLCELQLNEFITVSPLMSDYDYLDEFEEQMIRWKSISYEKINWYIKMNR